jgi:hypothetical protein
MRTDNDLSHKDISNNYCPAIEMEQSDWKIYFQELGWDSQKYYQKIK